MTALANTLGLPHELRTFTAPISDPLTGTLTLNAKTESRLRIRAAARQRPARVLRRGGKVIVLAPARPAPGFSDPHGSHRKAKRPRVGTDATVLELLNDEDEDHSPGHHKHRRMEDDDAAEGEKARGGPSHPNGGDGWDEQEGDGGDSEDHDELSVDLYDAADDDDQADVDEVGGDDDGGDYL